ncbi:DUF1990 domain-containing protein [Cryobacterium sp. MDB1-18-2]|uniref:DUF1990 family protein n=1 Tax=unclassified Cryobacterium TaxID=2649013 RepID=UPI00106C702F|nr:MULTISPECIES: DUF1990 family protein [unclassified Cryobacterium]TFC30730.1 DUF1990 domain-containing protein [Cryobacterium sp. MDB1-18-2]TFC38300.1 DUF1990 domain-containing protein [Cryobacterium sp. MDB1-18-1]
MTSPELRDWPSSDGGYRRSEVSAVVGRGDSVWERATRDVLRWRVKTASGFAVDSTGPVSPGDRVTVTARVLTVAVVEPVQVVEVVEEFDRVGFAYRTMPGHPVSGEEAFIVHRRGDEVRLTVRSLTRPSPQQPWRALYPLLLITQRIARKRYLRSLR